jgi:hypothetical protein
MQLVVGVQYRAEVGAGQVLVDRLGCWSTPMTAGLDLPSAPRLARGLEARAGESRVADLRAPCWHRTDLHDFHRICGLTFRDLEIYLANRI